MWWHIVGTIFQFSILIMIILHFLQLIKVHNSRHYIFGRVCDHKIYQNNYTQLISTTTNPFHQVQHNNNLHDITSFAMNIAGKLELLKEVHGTPQSVGWWKFKGHNHSTVHLRSGVKGYKKVKGMIYVQKVSIISWGKKIMVKCWLMVRSLNQSDARLQVKGYRSDFEC